MAIRITRLGRPVCLAGHVRRRRPRTPASDLLEGITMAEQMPTRVPAPTIAVQTAPLDPALLARVKTGLERVL